MSANTPWTFSPSVLFVITPSHQARACGLLRSWAYCLPAWIVTFEPFGVFTIHSALKLSSPQSKLASGVWPGGIIAPW